MQHIEKPQSGQSTDAGLNHSSRCRDDAIRIERITDDDALERLGNDWDTLAQSTRRHAPFLRHGWFAAAWAWRKDSDCRLCILLVYRGDRLAGICPLILSTSRYRSLKFRKLELLTIPDTQFCGILATPDDEAAVLEAVARWIRDHAGEWSILDLAYLEAGGTGTAGLADALARHGIRCHVRPHGENPCIDLSGTWEDFYRGRSRRLKKGNNLVANRLGKAGTIRIEWVRSGLDGKALQDMLGQVVGLSAGSWKKQTGLSLDHPGPGRFIRRLSEEANRNGSLSVWILYLDDRPLAMEYQLCEHGAVFALRSDFDQGHEDLSPGTYLNWKLMEKLFDSGLRTYYMGPGDNPYKRRWTDSAVPLARIQGYSRTLRGVLAGMFFEALIPAGKRLLGRHGDTPPAAEPRR